jgi:hypothetical protein
MSTGLGSPGLLKGFLEEIDRIGGDDQAKMSNLSGAFPGVPLAAIRTIFQNRKNFDSTELKGYGISDEALKGKAEANTAPLEKNAARIENGILRGRPIEEMAKAFTEAIKASLGGSVIELNNGQGKITLGGKAPAPIPQNKTKSPLDRPAVSVMYMP